MVCKSQKSSDASAGNWCDENDVIDTSTAPLTDDYIEYKQFVNYNPYGLEDFQAYNKGGMHPVHLDDILDDRFEVVHKLGNGGWGTVWLCRDMILGKWRAVKIMVADHSSSGREEKIWNHLRSRCTPEELEANHILLPLEQFWLEGPNGRHLCLVMPVCGWTVENWRLSQKDYKPETDPKARDVCRQIAKSLGFLHSNGICHGDFYPRNILMKVEGIDEMKKEEIMELMGEAQLHSIETESGEPSLRAPEYSVQPPDSFWCKDFSTTSIAVIDFGESFFIEDPPEKIGVPNLYAAPEVLFEGSGTPGPYSDIWSLACTLYEVRTSGTLLEGTTALGLPLDSIRSLLGPLPNHYYEALIEMLGDENVEILQSRHQLPRPAVSSTIEPDSDTKNKANRPKSDKERLDILKELLGGNRFVYVNFQKPENVPEEFKSSKYITWSYPEREVDELADLLHKMLTYDPTERINMEAVLSHPWVTKLGFYRH